MSKYLSMTPEERFEKFKFLLRYGEIISDNEIGDIRVRVILYNKKKYRHVMKAGQCINVTQMPI